MITQYETTRRIAHPESTRTPINNDQSIPYQTQCTKMYYLHKSVIIF